MTSGAYALKDPINRPGSWNNSGSYAEIHTQSTRNGGNFDCGSQGGMDDRFDQILVSQNVMNNSDNVEYQTGSYRAVGNDRSEEHTSELQSRPHLVCRLLLEKKKQKKNIRDNTK